VRLPLAEPLRRKIGSNIEPQISAVSDHLGEPNDTVGTSRLHPIGRRGPIQGPTA
jgi:hypothetical protein